MADKTDKNADTTTKDTKEKIFDPSTANASVVPDAPSQPSHQAAVASQASPVAGTHVPSTYDASVVASGAPAHPTVAPGAAAAIPVLSQTADPTIVGDQQPGVQLSVFLTMANIKQDQRAAFCHFAGSRHGDARYPVAQWQELLKNFNARTIK